MLPKYKLPEWFANGPHRPPHAEIGAANAEELYIRVGQICSDWETFEHKLMILLTVVAGFASTEGAVAGPFRAAFRSVISARSKQDIIHYVADETIAGRPEYDDLKRLLNHIRNLTALRNKAVHATVARQQSNDPARPWFVGPSASSKDYGLKEKPFGLAYRFNAEQLDQIRALISKFDGIVSTTYSTLASTHHVELEKKKVSQQKLTPPK